jgi:SAM-dependent methyltransferase
MLSLERQNRLREEYGRLRPGWRPATEVYAGLVRRYLRPESRLLDVGCGRGGLVEQLGHPLHQVVGVDPDVVSLREHRLPLPRAAALSLALPLAAGRFDVAFASWLLEHLEEPERDLAEVSRVLRPGGVFIFITPNRLHPLVSLNRLSGRVSRLQQWLVAGLYGRAAADTFPAYYRANTAADLQRLAGGSGLRLVEWQAIADPTYLAFHPALFRPVVWLDGRLAAGRAIHLVGVLAKEDRQ